MSLIVKMLVAIAALVLAANAGLDLIERLGLGENGLAAFGKRIDNDLETVSADAFQYGVFLDESAGANYSVAQPEDFEIEIEYVPAVPVPRGDGPPKERLVRALIPIRAETKKSPRNWRNSFGRYATWEDNDRSEVKAAKYSNGFPVWECSSATFSSILIYDFATGETKNVVPDGYAVTSYIIPPSYRSYDTEEGKLVVGTYVSEDANKDGVLNCNDPEKIFALNTSVGEFVSIDAGGQPFIINQREFYSHAGEVNASLISVGLDENGDGVYDPFTETLVPARLDLNTYKVTSIPGDN